MSTPTPVALGIDDLSTADQALFASHAKLAVEGRGKAFFQARRALWTDWLLIGAIGLVGILVLKWSAAQAALLLIATFWIGWLSDLALWLTRARALAISYQRAADDLRFWQIVSILRGKRQQPPDIRSHPTLGLSLCVDLVAGAAASVLLLSGLRTAGIDLAAEGSSKSLLIGAAVVVAGGIGTGLRARFTPSADGSVPLPVFSVGQRGTGLLLLVFAMMAVGGGALSATLLMGCVYGFFVVIGAIEMIWGLPGLRREVDWVRLWQSSEQDEQADESSISRSQT